MPDSWTSINGSALDWTYELQLHSEYDVLEAIRQAVVERCQASSTAVPTLLNSAIPQLYNTKAVTDSIQSTITTLIPLFVNHTDNGGNWSGQTTIPSWSEATILTAIGAGARLTQNQLNVSGDWAKQQYLILNLLRWVKNNSGLITEMQISTIFDPTWTTPPSGIITDGVFSTITEVGNWGLKRGKFCYNGITTVTSCSIDVYAFETGNDTWDIAYYPLYGQVKDLHRKLETLAENNAATRTSSLVQYIIIPETHPTKDYEFIGSNIGVLKFDGANGMKFKDW